MYHKNFSLTHQAIDTASRLHSASKNTIFLTPWLDMLANEEQKAGVNLLARSYTNIELSQVAVTLGLSEGDAKTKVSSLGWTLEGSIVSPVPPTRAPAAEGDLAMLGRLVIALFFFFHIS